jgi:hypothetical protein
MREVLRYQRSSVFDVLRKDFQGLRCVFRFGRSLFAGSANARRCAFLPCAVK